MQRFSLNKYVKLNHIKKIFFSQLNDPQLNGVIGLLSTFNMSQRQEKVLLYGPIGLQEYFYFISKYTQSNFEYSILIKACDRDFIMETNFCHIRSMVIPSTHYCMEGGYVFCNLCKKTVTRLMTCKNKMLFKHDFEDKFHKTSIVSYLLQIVCIIFESDNF